MTRQDYLNQVRIACSQTPYQTSEDAYAQKRQGTQAQSGTYEKRVFGVSSSGPKTKAATTNTSGSKRSGAKSTT